MIMFIKFRQGTKLCFYFFIEINEVEYWGFLRILNFCEYKTVDFSCDVTLQR